MDKTPLLSLPYIAPSQAQKHVTHNEALRMLDACVQLAVLDRDLTSPPTAPYNGERYIVAAGGSGLWAGHDSELAVFQDGAWVFFTPRNGWLAWISDEDLLAVWDGSTWMTAGPGTMNPAPMVGVNATADTLNRLSVQSPASLFSHEGASHRQTINKAAPADTASLLFQTGFSGRAEIGTTGDDDLRIKVSSDGTAWRDALSIEGNDANAALPGGLHGGQLTIANDAVESIPAPRISGVFFLWATDPVYPQPGAFGAVWFDCGGSLSVYNINLGSLCDSATGSANGTTGADGRLTIFCDTGRIMIENRLGGERLFRYLVMN
ncbi:MAG: DUF2793 domain-containing protein [Hoeflea sp.]|uniref:DUF2793 domain-containing protein n=1 Tax=Hoeflea sp. TaxID=1940281 RepID=UPI0032EF7AAB